MRILRAVLYMLFSITIVLAAYAVAAFMPADYLWYQPREIFVSNGSPGKEPTVSIKRDIYRRTEIAYHVIVRNERFEAVCDDRSNPFTYYPKNEALTGKSLTWWTGGTDCWESIENKPGPYFMETCWTVVRPFWGLVPPKTACIVSNVFSVTQIGSDGVEKLLQGQEKLEDQVRGLKLQLKEDKDD